MKNISLFLLSAVAAFSAEPLSWVGNPPLTTPGGTTGQVLTKGSNADYDVVWNNPAGGPAAAGTLTGATLAAGVTASSLTSAGGGTFGTAAFTAAGAYDAAGSAAAAQAASQPLDSDLTAIAAIATTAFGRSTLTQADAAALRTLAGLGTLATQSGTFSGTSSGTNTGDQTTVSGNAGTATALATPRAINGVNFDGTAPITVTAAAGTLSGATLASGVTASSLTSTGTLVAGGTAAGFTLAVGASTITGTLPFANGGEAGSAATSATTGTMTVNMTSSIITITPTGACTFNASGGVTGQTATFSITTSGVSSFVLTWGTNFRKTGTLATGTVAARFFTVTFRCLGGGVWTEISRTIVQT